MKIIINSAIAAVLSLVLVACGSTGSGSTLSDEEAIVAALDKLNMDRGDEVSTVPNFRINGWQAVNAQNLIVTSGQNTRYLLGLSTYCPDLNFAMRIALDIRGLSLTSGDTVVVTAQRIVSRCTINRITRLVPREDSA